jgi:hypothetical protein
MQLDDEIAAGIETPRRAFQHPRQLTRRPAQEMAVREQRRATAAAVESRSGLVVVETFRGGSPIDLEIRVMHGLGGPGIELQSPDVPRRRHRDRHHEAAKHIGTVALSR